jgi:hypothetical protein
MTDGQISVGFRLPRLGPRFLMRRQRRRCWSPQTTKTAQRIICRRKDPLTIGTERLTTCCGLEARVVCLFLSTSLDKKTKIGRVSALNAIVLDRIVCCME